MIFAAAAAAYINVIVCTDATRTTCFPQPQYVEKIAEGTPNKDREAKCNARIAYYNARTVDKSFLYVCQPTIGMK